MKGLNPSFSWLGGLCQLDKGHLSYVPGNFQIFKLLAGGYWEM